MASIQLFVVQLAPAGLAVWLGWTVARAISVRIVWREDE
jgi:hypothetical protein